MTNEMTNEMTIIDQIKIDLATIYKKQILNFFGNDKRALKFLSSVVSAIQKNPELMQCDKLSLINSFMTMAQLEFMPSDIGGEAYVLPYSIRGEMKAQFQLGYQGLVTLFYRAGVRSITAEIVFKEDKFSIKNGNIEHEPDIFSDERGIPIGAYVIIELREGGKIQKVMTKKEIIAIGSKFSKSYTSKYSPWNYENDPELWMWKKTVLKQASKLVPKNDHIIRVIEEDNRDSNIPERMEELKKENESLKMGNLVRGVSLEEVSEITEKKEPNESKTIPGALSI